MEQNFVRLLKANEIECRAATVSEKGLVLLLYKDARVDQRILDETFGAFGWKRSHQCIDGNLYCTVEILNNETGEWIAKQDVGKTGMMEKEKSQSSDSFKRACFNWGIGRELYSAPFIWIPAGKTNIQQKENKFYCQDRFSVKSISYNEEREISALMVINDKGQAVYELKEKKTAGNGKEKQDSKAEQSKKEPEKELQKNALTKKAAENAITKEQMASLQAELNRTGVAMEAVQDRYHIQKPESMSGELYERVMRALSKTKPTNAA